MIALAYHPLSEGSAVRGTCPSQVPLSRGPSAENLSLCPCMTSCHVPTWLTPCRLHFFYVTYSAPSHIFCMNLSLQHLEMIGVKPICLRSLYPGPSACLLFAKAVSCCGGQHVCADKRPGGCGTQIGGRLRAQKPHALRISLRDQAAANPGLRVPHSPASAGVP